MGKVPQISSQDLLRILGTFPQHILQDDSNRAFCLSLAVINQCFDREWVDQHVTPETPKPGFLRVVAGHDRETQRSTFRIVDFAELLLNLAHIDGVDRCLEDLRRGNMESTCAELDFGRMLYLGGVTTFRYVPPQAGENQITIKFPDGVTVCADAKCKIEATDFSEKTVENTLHDARDQFPKDQPSALFVKVPSRWTNEVGTALELLEIGRRFLAADQTNCVCQVLCSAH